MRAGAGHAGVSDHCPMDQPELAVAEVTITTAGMDADALRAFTAVIVDEVADRPAGSITGWLGLQQTPSAMYESADSISTDAEVLATAVVEILEHLSDEAVWTTSAVMVDRMILEPTYRGRRSSGRLLDSLLNMLQFDPDETVLVLQPEPQLPEGGPLPPGPEHDAALARLCDAYTTAGLEPWNDNTVWWRPVTAVI